MSRVRFASAEKLLDEFIRLRPVLLQLLDEPDFESLYPARYPFQFEARKTAFIDPIMDESLLCRIKSLKFILRACRIYLRMFDAEGAMSSDAYNAAEVLSSTLNNLPLALFPSPDRDNKKQELVHVFKNRMEGPLPNMKRVQVRLVSDLHIAAFLMDPFRCPVTEDHRELMAALRRQLGRYFAGVSLEPDELELTVRTIVFRYFDVRDLWKKRKLYRSDWLHSTERGRQSFTESPIGWWLSGDIPSYRDPHLQSATRELVEFAVRTLSVSPTACAAERSFSLQARMHSKERASLSQSTVQKLVYSHWNQREKMMRKYSSDAKKWELMNEQECNLQKLVEAQRNLMSDIRAMQLTQQSDERRE